MPASTFLANKLIDHQLGKTSFTMPTVYVGLSSTTPTAGGTNITEPSGGAYARVATSAATWNAASSGSATNAQAVTFTTASADWVSGSNLTHAVFYDASSGGNFLAFGSLGTAKAVLNGDTASFAAGQITVSLT